MSPTPQISGILDSKPTCTAGYEFCLSVGQGRYHLRHHQQFQPATRSRGPSVQANPQTDEESISDGGVQPQHVQRKARFGTSCLRTYCVLARPYIVGEGGRFHRRIRRNSTARNAAASRPSQLGSMLTVQYVQKLGEGGAATSESTHTVRRRSVQSRHCCHNGRQLIPAFQIRCRYAAKMP